MLPDEPCTSDCTECMNTGLCWLDNAQLPAPFTSTVKWPIVATDNLSPKEGT